MARFSALAWSPDGQTLASAGGWGEVFFWETATGRRLRTLGGPTTPVLSVAWSPDGRSLAAGSELPEVFVWDVATGRPRAVLLGLTGDRALALLASGHHRCPPEVKRDLVYVLQTDRGQETLTAKEFRSHDWSNDPGQVRPAGD